MSLVARRHELFDAIGHSFRRCRTGGFSTHDDSVAHFDSMTISLILALFMFLGGVNFVAALSMMFREQQPRQRTVATRVPEAYTAIMLSLGERCS